MGSSKPWTEAIRVLTRGRTTRMDAGPIMEYFQPLMAWLREQNMEDKPGWSIHSLIQIPFFFLHSKLIYFYQEV